MRVQKIHNASTMTLYREARSWSDKREHRMSCIFLVANLLSVQLNFAVFAYTSLQQQHNCVLVSTSLQNGSNNIIPHLNDSTKVAIISSISCFVLGHDCGSSGYINSSLNVWNVCQRCSGTRLRQEKLISAGHTTDGTCTARRAWFVLDARRNLY